MPPESTGTEVAFSADLYVLAAIEESVAAFGELAKLSVDATAEASTIIVRYSDVREDVADAFADEFCNHALAGTIEHRRLAEV